MRYLFLHGLLLASVMLPGICQADLWQTIEVFPETPGQSTDTFQAGATPSGETVFLTFRDAGDGESERSSIRLVKLDYLDRPIILNEISELQGDPLHVGFGLAFDGETALVGDIASRNLNHQHVADDDWVIWRAPLDGSTPEAAMKFSLGPSECRANDIRASGAFVIAIAQCTEDGTGHRTSWIARSSDGGRTFEAPSSLPAPEGAETDAERVLIYGNGAAVAGYSVRGTSLNGLLWTSADGASWTAHEYVAPGEDVTRFLAIRAGEEGRILLPGNLGHASNADAAAAVFEFDPAAPASSAFRVLRAFDMDVGTIALPITRDLAITGDGVIFAGVRMRASSDFDNFFWRIFSSSDGGETWNLSDSFYGPLQGGSPINYMYASPDGEIYAAGVTFETSGNYHAVLRRLLR